MTLKPSIDAALEYKGEAKTKKHCAGPNFWDALESLQTVLQHVHRGEAWALR